MSQTEPQASLESQESTDSLAQSLEHLIGVDTVHELSSKVCLAVRELLSCAGATFVLADGEQVHYAEELAEGRLWKGQRFPVNACISGWAITHRKMATVADIREDERIPQEAYRPTFVRSLMMMPLVDDDEKVRGALGAYWAEPRSFSSKEQRALQKLARAALKSLNQAEIMEDCARLKDAPVHSWGRADQLMLKMVPIVAHDLRTPLSAMVTGLEILGHEELTARGQRALRHMRSSAQRAHRLVSQLLDFSEVREHGSIPIYCQQANLETLSQQNLAEFRMLEPDRTFDTRIEPVEGYWDADRISQALSNLLRNAVEHGEAERPIELVVRQ